MKSEKEKTDSEDLTNSEMWLVLIMNCSEHLEVAIEAYNNRDVVEMTQNMDMVRKILKMLVVSCQIFSVDIEQRSSNVKLHQTLTDLKVALKTNDIKMMMQSCNVLTSIKKYWENLE